MTNDSNPIQRWVNWVFLAASLLLWLYSLQGVFVPYLNRNKVHILLLRLVSDRDWPAGQSHSLMPIKHTLYHTNSWRNYGFLLTATGLHDEAILSYQNALEAVPSDVLASYFLGIEQLQLTREAEAIQAWQRVSPDQISNRICQEIEIAIADDPKQVEKWVEILLVLSPNDFNTQYCAGRGYAAAGRQQVAVIAFEEAIRIGTTDRRSLRNLYRQKGNIHMEMSQWAEAVDAYRQAIELAPDNSAIWANLGLALTRAGDYSAAEQVLLDAITANPQSMRPYQRLGTLYQQQGDYERAAYWYHRAAEVAPASSTPLRDLGVLALRFQEDPQRAQQYFHQAVAIEPDVRANWLWLARSQGSLGQLDEMEDAYRQAAQLSDSLASRVSALTELAEALLAQEKPERSLAVWYHILEIELTNDEARLMIQAIEARQQHDE
jgi:tetratricopeptide (TPR) repeat protein